ncbi:carbohydrate ABC transporter permease [Microbacterium sp. YY-01]|uniref:carbohydrate ABC transporter permease n=1 Tax=Microbacterium sp. YY-01 TaxID=3421634 RepID=UPI003D1719C8
MTTARASRGLEAGSRSESTGSAPRRKRRQPFPWFKYVTLAPLVVLTLAFVAYPIFELIKTSFGKVQLFEGNLTWSFVGFDNYAKMLEDPIFPVTIGNTIVFIVAAVLITVFLGVMMALITDRVVRGQTFFQNILIWPAVIAPVVISVLWLLILSPQLGLINKALRVFGLEGQTWLGDPAGAMASIIFVDVWHWTPLVYLLVYTALRTIDSSILEAAQVDGASYLKIIRSVILPILTPAIVGVAAVRLIMSVKVFDEMYLLTHGGPGLSTTVISLYIRTVFFDRLDFGYGSALSIVVIVSVLLALIIGVAGRSLFTRIRND